MHTTADGKSDKREMGRPRAAMTGWCRSQQNNVQEHIWKLIAYYHSRPRDVPGWLDTVNAFIQRAQSYNEPKGRTGTNVRWGYLSDIFIDENFGQPGDVQVQNRHGVSAGYPAVADADLSPAQRACKSLSHRMCDIIMDPAQDLLAPSDVEHARAWAGLD